MWYSVWGMNLESRWSEIFDVIGDTRKLVTHPRKFERSSYLVGLGINLATATAK